VSQPAPGEQPPAPEQPCAEEQPQAAVAPTAENEKLSKAVELNKAKKYTEAESEIRAALAAEPANPNAHLQLAIALFEQGKIDPAGTELEQAAAVEQTGTPAEKADFHQYRGSYRARKAKWAEAAQDLEKAIQLDPKEPYNHYYIGVAYNNLKKPDKMVEHLQTFLKLAPDAPEAAKCKALLRAVN